MTKRSRQETRAQTGGLDTVTEATYLALRRAILDLELTPGALLPIRLLRLRFPFGPTPLREALSRLSGEGLAQPATQRGFRVAPLGTDELNAIRTQSIELEPLALRRAMAANAPQWRAQLQAAHDAFAPLEGGAIDRQWEERHGEFHLALLAGCGSASLLARIVELNELIGRYRRAALAGMARADLPRLPHAPLLHAALGRDAGQAEALLREHLREATGRITALFKAAMPG